MRSILILALTATLASGQKTDRAEVQLEAAIKLEFVDGDLKGAIEQYKKVIAAYRSNHAVAAKALVQLGQCYEKQGNAEARNAYDQVLRDYPDQKDLAATARARLAALAQPPKPKVLTTRRVYPGEFSGRPLAVSPDGRYALLWNSALDLTILDLNTGQRRPLTHVAHYPEAYVTGEPVFSLDGRQIAYMLWSNREYELRVVSADGSGDRSVWRAGKDRIEVEGWFPDGKRFVGLVSPEKNGPRRIVVVSLADGSVKVLKESEDLTRAQLSPDGNYVAYLVTTQRGSLRHRHIWLLSLADLSEAPIVQHPADHGPLSWAPDSKGLLFLSTRRGTRDLWYVPVGGGKAQGPPQLIKPEMGTAQPITMVTRDGAYYYRQSIAMTDVYEAELDIAAGKVVTAPSTVAPGSAGHTQCPAFSRGGERIAYVHRVPNAPPPSPLALAIRATATGEEHEIPLRFSYISALQWFPDGRSLLLLGNHPENGRGIYRLDAESGKSTPVKTRMSRYFGALISPDGKTIYYGNTDTPAKETHLRAYDVDSGEERELFKLKGISAAAISPDGRKLAVIRFEEPPPETGKLAKPSFYTVEVLPVGGGEAREIYRVEYPNDYLYSDLEWSPDGSYLLFTGRSRKMDGRTELRRIPAEGGAMQRMDILMPGLRSVTLHPDGRHIAFESGYDQSEVWVLENFLPTAAK